MRKIIPTVLQGEVSSPYDAIFYYLPTDTPELWEGKVGKLTVKLFFCVYPKDKISSLN